MNKENAQQIIQVARKEGRKTLSEYEAKQVLAAYDIPVTREILVEERQALADALGEIGYPLVMKGCAADIAHKTEKNLVRLDLRSEAEATTAFDEITAGMKGNSGGVLVQEMISGRRELVIGLTRDPQFGACVMFGLGGILPKCSRTSRFARRPSIDRTPWR